MIKLLILYIIAAFLSVRYAFIMNSHWLPVTSAQAPQEQSTALVSCKKLSEEDRSAAGDNCSNEEGLRNVKNGLNMVNDEKIAKEGAKDKTPLPALPSPDSRREYRQLNLGETIKIDDIGPLIVNTDGTTRMIANWATMTKAEQDNTMRLITARNRKRLAVLREQQAENDET